jgi:hypothetical protein
MSASEEIFRVTDKWGDEIVLTEKDWSRIITKKPGVSRDRTDNPLQIRHLPSYPQNVLQMPQSSAQR